MDSLFKKVGMQNEKLLKKDESQGDQIQLNKNEILSKYKEYEFRGSDES